jgi:hypothetical protein
MGNLSPLSERLTTLPEKLAFPTLESFWKSNAVPARGAMFCAATMEVATLAI